MKTGRSQRQRNAAMSMASENDRSMLNEGVRRLNMTVADQNDGLEEGME